MPFGNQTRLNHPQLLCWFFPATHLLWYSFVLDCPCHICSHQTPDVPAVFFSGPGHLASSRRWRPRLGESLDWWIRALLVSGSYQCNCWLNGISVDIISLYLFAWCFMICRFVLSHAWDAHPSRLTGMWEIFSNSTAWICMMCFRARTWQVWTCDICRRIIQKGTWDKDDVDPDPGTCVVPQ